MALTDCYIRVVPDNDLRLEASRMGWKLHSILGCWNFTLRGLAIKVAKTRAANGMNREHIVAAEEDGTFTVLEIEETHHEPRAAG